VTRLLCFLFGCRYRREHGTDECRWCGELVLPVPRIIDDKETTTMTTAELRAAAQRIIEYTDIVGRDVESHYVQHLHAANDAIALARAFLAGAIASAEIARLTAENAALRE
jgi:hypothetical protein